MKFERLRRAVEEAESELRNAHDFTEHDLSAARSGGMYRSWNWFNDRTPREQEAILEYQKALKELAKAERDEIERMRKETK